jgi:hypothetical protein
LQEGAGAGEADFFEHVAQLGHGDHVVTGYVDSSK